MPTEPKAATLREQIASMIRRYERPETTSWHTADEIIALFVARLRAEAEAMRRARDAADARGENHVATVYGSYAGAFTTLADWRGEMDDTGAIGKFAGRDMDDRLREMTDVVPEPTVQLIVTEPAGPDSLGGGVLYLPPEWIGRRVLITAVLEETEEG